MPSIDFAGFDGIRNAVPDYRIGTAELSSAVNVDIDDSKRIIRRPGFTELSPGSAHSLFSNGEYCLYVTGTNLMLLHPDFTSSVLLEDVSGNRVSYQSINGKVYFSDGLKSFVTDGNTVTQWGITPPNEQPMARISDGLLPQGMYQFALTFLRNDGEESGTGGSGVIETIGGIEFYNIPVSADPSIDRKRIYVTAPDGKTMYLALQIPNSATSAIYAGDAVNLGISLQTQFYQHAPVGEHVSMFNGHALIAVHEFLLYSDYLYFQRFDPVRQSYAFDSRINMIAPVQGGVFIGTEKSIVFLAGDDITQAQHDKKASYGVIPHTLAYVDGSMVLSGMQGVVGVFASNKGICVIGDGGSFQNITVDRYVYPVTHDGAAVARIKPGMNQYIAALR
jgi:hypothetical protein